MENRHELQSSKFYDILNFFLQRGTRYVTLKIQTYPLTRGQITEKGKMIEPTNRSDDTGMIFKRRMLKTFTPWTHRPKRDPGLSMLLGVTFLELRDECFSSDR